MSRPETDEADEPDVGGSDVAETEGSTTDADESVDKSDLLSSVPSTDEHPILLFDGVCDLCSSLVRFVVQRDEAATFRFASLQSPVGQSLLEEYGLATDGVDTVVLVEGGAAYRKSEAALRASRHFDGLSSLLRFFLVVPRPVRNRAYDVVAANRYDWFGRKDSCLVPTEDVRGRFLENGVGPAES